MHTLARLPVTKTAIAIPAKNEADHIGACLRALAGQTRAPSFIVLCVNDTSDDTIPEARAVALPLATELHIMACSLPAEQAHAGTARRLAMDEAARLAGPDGVILSTDADGVADPDWVEQNLRILNAGADVVAGWVDLDAAGHAAIPAALHAADAEECAYDALCDEIHARLDPDPADPLPRHTQHSGASIALWSRFYAACGGVPLVRGGEDRALIMALRRVDARIRHAPECHVTVSGRMMGRAPGGMADTIRRRLTAPDLYIDDRLEPAEDCARRASLRAALRRRMAQPGMLRHLAAEAEIDPQWLEQALEHPSFGAVWAHLEEHCPALVRRRVAVSDLAEQTRLARRICDDLRSAAQQGACTADGETIAMAG